MDVFFLSANADVSSKTLKTLVIFFAVFSSHFHNEFHYCLWIGFHTFLLTLIISLFEIQKLNTFLNWEKTVLCVIIIFSRMFSSPPCCTNVYLFVQTFIAEPYISIALFYPAIFIVNKREGMRTWTRHLFAYRTAKI